MLALTLAGLHFFLLPWIDRSANTVSDPGPYRFDSRIREFHDAAFVADLHADSLLWGRDLRKRHGYGQADLPRLIEGGVDLQVFSVVTKTPRGLNVYSNPADSDTLPALFIASLRAPSTWFDPKQRALAQAREFHQYASTPELTAVLRRQDLEASGLKGLLALEGMHALGGEADALDELFAAGYRMMGLAHFFDNAVSGSAHGLEKYGLTDLGKQLVPRMEALGITIDLAHASPRAFSDTLGLARNPVVVSHGGVNATCPGPRNLTNAQLRAVARNGGVVGIGYWRRAVCQPDLDGIVHAIKHTIDIAGIDHVGLGSDFDGYVGTPFDTRGLPLLTAALLDAGLSREAVAKILGGNVQRVLARNLPR